MCAITGFFNTPDTAKHTHSALSILKNRGKDAAGVCGAGWVQHFCDVDSLKIPEPNSTAILGHALHSMVNFVPQPIVYKGRLVANCEIYNWKELAEKYNIEAKNDSDLLIKFIEQIIAQRISDATSATDFMENLDLLLREFIGVYALAYWLDDRVYLARDLIGIKPLWYSTQTGFAFASEKKALEAAGYLNVRELNPREILCYDIKEDTLTRYNREFFSITPEHGMPVETICSDVRAHIEDAVSIRIPDEPFGILFSGGVDSTIIAYLCKQLGKRPGVDFTCYVAGFQGETPVPDVEYAKQVAETLGLVLKVTEIDLGMVEEYLKTVVPLIEDTSVPKVGVGLTMYACLLYT